MPSAELRDTPDHDPALFTTGMAGEKASEATTSAAIAAILSAVGMVFQTISVQMWCEIGDKSSFLDARAHIGVGAPAPLGPIPVERQHGFRDECYGGEFLPNDTAGCGPGRRCLALHFAQPTSPGTEGRVETGWTDVNARPCRAFQRWIAGREMLFPMMNVPAAAASLSTSIFHSCDGRGRRVTSVVYCRGVTKGSGNVLEQRECSHRPQRNRSECSGEIESSMSMSLKSLPFCRCMRRRRG